MNYNKTIHCEDVIEQTETSSREETYSSLIKRKVREGKIPMGLAKWSSPLECEESNVFIQVTLNQVKVQFYANREYCTWRDVGVSGCNNPII
jgi:hypothetical protein